jgi:hypothetical protein
VTTSVIISAPVFHADHPFLFFIRERQTGSILFLGRLLKPSVGAVAAPELTVSRSSASTITLSWSISSAPFVLQESSSLKTPGWTTVTNANTVLGQQNQTVLSRSSGNKFYRLMTTRN